MELAADPRSDLPEAARVALEVLIDVLRSLHHRIKHLDVEIARRAREDKAARRLATIPGVGSITATAFIAWPLRPRPLKRAATSLPGSGSRRNRTRPAESKNLAQRRRWVSEPCGACSSSSLAPSCGTLAAAGTPQGSWLARMLSGKPFGERRGLPRPGRVDIVDRPEVVEGIGRSREGRRNSR